MEHDFRISGERRERLLSGIYTTIENVSFSMGPALVGFVLAAAGYVAYATGDVVPFVKSLVGCVLQCYYNLDARQFRRPPASR